MPRKKTKPQLVIEKHLITPSDNRTKEAKNFWSRESCFFSKLYKKYPNYDFWNKVTFKGSIIDDGKLPSFLLFFDKDNNYWIKLLDSKWKDFNWKPKKLKSYKFDKNIEPETKPASKKRHIRDFFS